MRSGQMAKKTAKQPPPKAPRIMIAIAVPKPKGAR